MGRANDRKARKAKARKETLRKRKAAGASQPRVLRQNPDLAEALSTRHPLVGYFVNEDWESSRMATVTVIRDAPSGEVFGNFLVDLMWRGTKDVYGNFGLTSALAMLQSQIEESDAPCDLIPLEQPVAVNLIRGGVEWARRWRTSPPKDLDLWLRLVDPAPAGGLDLTMFGQNGERPIVTGALDEVGSFFRPGATPDGRLLPADFDDEDLDDEFDDEFDDEPGPTTVEPHLPGGLWLPSQSEADGEEEEPRPPHGLWLPPR